MSVFMNIYLPIYPFTYLVYLSIYLSLITYYLSTCLTCVWCISSKFSLSAPPQSTGFNKDVPR